MQIVVPDSQDLITTHVFRHQADWSDDEIILVDQQRDIAYPAILIVVGQNRRGLIPCLARQRHQASFVLALLLSFSPIKGPTYMGEDLARFRRCGESLVHQSN